MDDYTDMALRKFFETASKMSWFKNTLFVLTADHATISNFPEYQTSWGYMSIPIVFYHPGDSLLAKAEKTVAQQTDIMPSVLDYLHYSGKIVSFGKSIFAPADEHFVVNYNNGFQLLKDNYLARFDGQKITGLFDYIHDRLLTTDLKEKMPAISDSMEQKIKAYIQQYHNRLIEDRMRPK
jgi:phosphoglycerol transferase MdoB-like AlkP superfamily enzyme